MLRDRAYTWTRSAPIDGRTAPALRVRRAARASPAVWNVLCDVCQGERTQRPEEPVREALHHTLITGTPLMQGFLDRDRARW
jgi:hypothetical protein